MNRIDALLKLQKKKIEHERYKESSDNTFATYFRAISSLISKFDGLPDDVASAYEVILDNFEKPRTINTYRYAIEWFYGEKLGRKKLNEGKPEVGTISVDNIKCILDTMLDENDYYYACLTAMFYYIAMRINEALAIRKGDITISEKPTITVYPEKSDDTYIVPIPRDALSYILPYFKHIARIKKKNDRIFERDGKLPSDRIIIYKLNRYAKACSIEEHITPHTFRRSRATYLIKNGVPDSVVRTLLRQSSVQAIAYYTKVSPEVLRKFIDEEE